MPATLSRSHAQPAMVRRAATIRVGYVPLLDAAPLVIAETLGLFSEAGVNVRLERELGWGSIREKIVYGELDAAHAPGGLIFSILSGTHAVPREVVTDTVLSLQGNAITLSRRLWQKGVRDLSTLRAMIRSELPRRIVLGVVSPFSSHLHLLRRWLLSGDIPADQAVRLAVLPPPLVVEHMQEGLIDGFCVGEPWNSLAALTGEGWIAATSTDLDPGHAEKVLVVTEEFRSGRADDYAALRRAVVAACAFCDDPAHRGEVVDILVSRGLFPVDRSVLANALVGPLERGADLPADPRPLLRFHRPDVNRVTRERALWFLESVTETGSLTLDPARRRRCMEAFIENPNS